MTIEAACVDKGRDHRNIAVTPGYKKIDNAGGGLGIITDHLRKFIGFAVEKSPEKENRRLSAAGGAAEAGRQRCGEFLAGLGDHRDLSGDNRILRLLWFPGRFVGGTDVGGIYGIGGDDCACG